MTTHYIYVYKKTGLEELCRTGWMTFHEEMLWIRYVDTTEVIRGNGTKMTKKCFPLREGLTVRCDPALYSSSLWTSLSVQCNCAQDLWDMRVSVSSLILFVQQIGPGWTFYSHTGCYQQQACREVAEYCSNDPLISVIKTFCCSYVLS